MAERFVARVSKGRTLLLIFGAVVFVALGALIVANPAAFARSGRYSQEFITIAGGAAILFFAFCGGVGLRQLLRTDPVMEIGPVGLRWVRWSDQTIPWSAFERAERISIQNQKMLTLWLRDPRTWESTTLLGRTAGANKALGYGDITLTSAGLDQSFDAMAEAVARHAPQLFRR